MGFDPIFYILKTYHMETQNIKNVLNKTPY